MARGEAVARLAKRRLPTRVPSALLDVACFSGDPGSDRSPGRPTGRGPPVRYRPRLLHAAAAVIDDDRLGIGFCSNAAGPADMSDRLF